MIPAVKTEIYVDRCPDWVRHIARTTLFGEEVAGENEVSLSVDGSLVYHRKITRDDIEKYNPLWNIDEVWIVQDVQE